jgi:hypothetical protein
MIGSMAVVAFSLVQAVAATPEAAEEAALVGGFMLAPASAPAPAAASDGGEAAYLVEDPFDIEVDEEEAAQAPPAAAEPAQPSRERLICRSRPELNSRTRWLRVCMTAAEWDHHATNMEQQRRDINDWGAQGGPSPF